MSASTPEKTSSIRTRRNGSSSAQAELPFWGISVTLHALMIGSVFMFAPVREIVFRRKIEEPEVITRGDELEAVIEQVRDRTVEKLHSRVALLEAGQERMATNFATLNEFYQPFVEQQRATARDRMDKHIADVLPRQDELRKLIEAAKTDGTPEKPVAFAHEWVSRILTAQEEIRRGMRLLELGGPELLAKQREAEETQAKASQFMRWLDGELHAIARENERLVKYEEELVARKAKVPEAENAVFEAKVAEKDAEHRVREADTRRAEFSKAKEREQEMEARKALVKARETLNGARRRVGDATRALQRANDDVKRKAADIEKARQRLADATKKRDSHLTVGYNVQNGAYHRQKAAIDTVRELLAESEDEN